MEIPDLKQRETALDITRSFIVQAPAGSGKTSLLTQRFVKLLQNSVHAPEEIIAITFTRKAAAEMRHRVLSLLPTCHPHRLRIMTIDAFCAFLCAQMPLKSKLSDRFVITENADCLYEQAIQNLFLHHANIGLEDFLLYLDNDSLRVKALLTEILKNRDQWLPHIFRLDAIAHLEQALQNIILEANRKTQDFISPKDFAALQAQSENIADLFLTQKGELRKKLPKEFNELKDIPEDFISHLKDLQYLPPRCYSDSQKKFILALSKILPLLIAELQLVFKDIGEYDFIEISLRASEALGDEDSPTDLNLKLDYQIKHLLIDEFQDTSLSQWRLLQKITAGWEPEDGRTLFLVGDPMQSIYRFRKAEVGLFLEVQKHGLNHITLNPLVLSSNFRSDQLLVNWFNQNFSEIFPKVSDSSIGAIVYSPSIGQQKGENTKSVFYHAIDNNDQEKEAEDVISAEAGIIAKVIQDHPKDSIAILVRSRSHLKEIIPVLQNKKIPFRAIEIANLADHFLIEDLFTLTKALLHPADRIAWLSIIRAPWCGLKLEDLDKLIINTKHKTILDNLLDINQENNTQKFNPETYLRIKHFLEAMQWAMENRGRLSLREWIEKTWLKLKGHYCLSNPSDLKIAEKYFDLLDQHQDIAIIQNQLFALSIPIENCSDNRVDIMTIHKAKGLEFDRVIIPGLEKSTRAESSKLFLWTERLNDNGNMDLLIAPVKSTFEKNSKIYDYLKYEENKREEYELQRLFYVACTRAKRNLHLLFSVNIKTPAKKSFLAQLWPLISDKIDLKSRIEKNLEITISPLLRRLPIDILDLKLELESKSVNKEKFLSKNSHISTFSQLQQRHIGIIVHEALQYLSENDNQITHNLSEAYLKRRLLQQSGTEEGFEIIQKCLENIRGDSKASWILKKHREAKSEYPLTTVVDHKINHIIIDRTFIDEKNIRWIIDYKITENISPEKYRAQLEKYARIFKQIETLPVCLGLYFPLTRDWVEWEFGGLQC